MFKYALCNEMFGETPHEEVFATVRRLGYTGIEIAPFTLAPGEEPFDVRRVGPQVRTEVRSAAEGAGLEVVGLHWLLAKTEGLYLTSPEDAVRRRTSDYLRELARLCRDLGGTIMVLGSPQQRNLLPGVSHDEAMAYAAAVLRDAMPVCEELNVTIAVEPLGPAEGDFLLTAAKGRELVKLVDSPHCKLHLDVKAMSSETLPIPDLIRASRDEVVHFHANDPNLLGPGMGEVEYEPIFAALREIGYAGWVSVEVFDYSPGPERIARESIEYMRQTSDA
jgi:sugar phosphate isomerase/epimerase